MLFEAGELQGAQAVLSDGFQLAAGAPAVQARIRVLLADVRYYQGAGIAEALAECEAATTVLEAGGDRDGLAEALTSAGRLRALLGDAPAYRGGPRAGDRLRPAKRQSPRADARQ